MAIKKKSTKKRSHVRNYATMEAQITQLQELVASLQEELKRRDARDTSSGHNAKRPSGVRSFAALDAQIAQLLEQNAAILAELEAVREENAALREGRAYKSNCSLSPSRHSSRATSIAGRSSVLATPTLQSLNAISPTTLRVAWNPVPNAGGYTIKTATNNLLTTDVRTFDVGASATFMVLSGFTPNTRYFVQVMAKGDGVEFTDSNWSTYKNTETWQLGDSGESGGSGNGGNGGDDSASQLKNLFHEMQNLFTNTATLVPELGGTALDTTERRRLLGSGVRRYGFIKKVAEVSKDFPQFWPAFADDGEELRRRVAEIDVLRNMLVWFRFVTRIVGDLVLQAGDDSLRIAGAYYATTREGARRRIPEARQVFQLLQLLWHKRRRSASGEEPIEMEMEDDLCGLIRGTKDDVLFPEYCGNRSTQGKRC